MTAFSDYYQIFQESVGMSGLISDSLYRKSQYNVTNHLAHRQCMEFAPLDGLTSSDSCEAITTQDIDLRPVSSAHAAQKAPLYSYESAIDSLGQHEIINHSIINEEHVAAKAIYGPSVCVDHGDRVLYPKPKSTGTQEGKGCDATHLTFDIPGDGSCIEVPLAKNKTARWRMKKRKTDPCVSGSVPETNVPVILKKSKRETCKSPQNSSASNDEGEGSNHKLDVTGRDPPQSLFDIVKNEPKTESQKDYIHVRARRGQATDSHSLAERVRRQKISDRMNVLQNLIPGCSKLTSKALVLEEIINYVQSLQSQVKILSMKLACVTPLCSFDQQNTSHLSRVLLPLQAFPDPIVAYGTATSYVDPADTVTQFQTPGTFLEECSTRLFCTANGGTTSGREWSPSLD